MHAVNRLAVRNRRDKEGLRMQETYIWRHIVQTASIICSYHWHDQGLLKFNRLYSHLPTVRVNVSMYVTDYSVIETPVKKLYNSVLQLSGPHKRRSKTGRGSSTKLV